MTTNQTIDGVPRKYVMHLTDEAHSVMLGMVEHCLNIRACMGMDEGFKDFDTEEEHGFVKELRALLDAPAVSLADEGEMPADQIQVVPVAYADPKAFENFGTLAHLGGLYAREWMWANPAPGLVPLYAEQPAPVAADEMDEFSKWTHEVIAESRINGVTIKIQRMQHLTLSEEKAAHDAWMARAALSNKSR